MYIQGPQTLSGQSNLLIKPTFNQLLDDFKGLINRSGMRNLLEKVDLISKHLNL